MRKKFIQSTFLLLIGGIITKLLSIFIKIIMTRRIGLEGISLYMLVLPTFSFAISIGQAGFPFSLSRVVAKSKNATSNFYYTSSTFLFAYHILLFFFLLISASFISNHLLHQEDAYLPILAIAFVIPFTTLSSILRSYFIGKEKMEMPVLSNILENLIRILFVLFLLPLFSHYSVPYLVFIVILSNILSEGISCFLLYLFLPKVKGPFQFHFSYLKELFSIAFPTLCGSFIGNITYFLEPILLTSILLFQGYSNHYILQEYGILSGYVFPIIFLPSFFTTSIGQAIFPHFTREWDHKRITSLKKSFTLILLFTLFFSICFIFVFFLFGKELLSFLYHTQYGFEYLKILAPFCFFYYVQPIFTYFFLAIGKSKEILYSSIISSILRISSISLFLFLGKGIYGFLLSVILNISFTTLFQYYRSQIYLS